MTFPAYPSYKDAGVEWLGKVPAHWSIHRITELYREVAEPGNEDLPILSVSIHDGVSDGEAEPDEEGRKVSRSDDRTKYKQVRPNDLVYNMMRAWQGGFGSVKVRGMVSPAYIVARPKGDNPSELVELLLRTPAAIEEMRRRSKGVTDFRLRLYWDEFKDMRIALPPRPEQSEILQFLNRETTKIDALVEEQRRLILLLKEKRQAVISQAVTKGLKLDTPMKDSGIEWIGKVPAHWKVMALKRLFAAVEYGISETLEPEGAIAVLRMGNISGGAVILNDVKFVNGVDDSLLLKKDDLLFNRTNSLDQIAKVGIFEGADYPVSFASYLVRIRTTEEVCPRYLALMLNLEQMLGVARSRAFISIGQCNLNPTRYGEIVIAIPALQEQRAIVAALEGPLREIASLQNLAIQSLELLRERRASLISAAISGKIDVRNSEKMLSFPVARARARGLKTSTGRLFA